MAFSSECIIGEVKMLFSTIIDPGWILFSDTPLDKVLYSKLWNRVKDWPPIEVFDEQGNPIGAYEVIQDLGAEFVLPNIQGRIFVAAGDRNDIEGISPRKVGEVGGAEAHKLTTEEMPVHNHKAKASDQEAEDSRPNDVYLGKAIGDHFIDAPNTEMAPSTDTGGDEPHNNMQPWIGINYIIFTGVKVSE